MTVKPWLSVIVAPTGAPRGNPAKPDARLQLDWVHGYRAQDVRGNLRYNHLGNLVYVPACMPACCPWCRVAPGAVAFRLVTGSRVCWLQVQRGDTGCHL